MLLCRYCDVSASQMHSSRTNYMRSKDNAISQKPLLSVSKQPDFTYHFIFTNTFTILMNSFLDQFSIGFHSNKMSFNHFEILLWFYSFYRLHLRICQNLTHFRKYKISLPCYMEILQHKNPQGMCLQSSRYQRVNKQCYEPR